MRTRTGDVSAKSPSPAETFAGGPRLAPAADSPDITRDIMRRTWRIRYARLIPRHLDDAALVAAAQGGDRFALDQLLRRHYDRIHAVCRRVAGSTREADDACQEALIKIVRSLPRFDGRSAFGTWAYRIATNASLDELRKRQRRPALHAVGEEDRPEMVDPKADRYADSFPDRLLLDDALDGLPEDLRVAVVLRDVADFDYAEIAETLDVPVGTVKSRISRGRAALATQLRIDEDRHRTRGNRPPPGERPTDPT